MGKLSTQSIYEKTTSATSTSGAEDKKQYDTMFSNRSSRHTPTISVSVNLKPK